MERRDPPTRGDAPSRRLGEFLIDLAKALQKHAIYPVGHPSLDAVADGVVVQLRSLLRDRSALSVGVERKQLVVEGVATDAAHPVVQQLAMRLHAHHLGAIRFKPGINADELVQVLRALAVEPDHLSSEPLGLLPDSAFPDWAHVTLYRLSLDQLHLVEEDERDATRSARLWMELARTALPADGAEDDPEPDAVARAIEAHTPSPEYDQAVAGCLLEIARELRSGESAEARVLRRRMHGLLDTLEPDALERLLRMGGDLNRQRRFMLDVVASLHADAVLKLMTATAEAAGRPLSGPLLRILAKLAHHASRTDATAHEEADRELRAVVGRMLDGWASSGPNPADDGFALEGLARTAEASVEAGADDPVAPERMLQMCLETGAVGAPAERAMDILIEALRVTELLDILDHAPDNEAAEAAWQLLSKPERLALVIRQPDLKFDRIAPLIRRLGPDAAPLLLDALSESEDRSTRRAAFDLLTHIGPAVLPLVDERLDDDRWFVLRNLLAVHNELGTAPEGAAEQHMLHHTDPRVRREAVKIGLRAPDHRSAVLRAALGDPDERVLQYGLVAALDGVPINAVPLVLARAQDDELKESIRVAAIRVLGRLGQTVALRALLELATEGKGLLGGVKLARSSPVSIAAIAALAEGWADHPDSKEVLDRARASRDAAVRRAAQGKVTP